MTSVNSGPATEFPFSTCPDAQVLLSFEAEVRALVNALEGLDQKAEDMRELSPSKARDVMMFSAGRLQARITDVRNALLRHDRLTKGRETVLVELCRAIDHLENILRSRMSTDRLFWRRVERALEDGLAEWMAERINEKAASESLTVADRALEAIENAYPNWITSREIGTQINKKPGSVRAALSDFARKFRGILPYESETEGDGRGYRWIKA